MSSAQCDVIPPAGPMIADGVKVYRCTGMVFTDNDTDAEIIYGVYLVLQTSRGHRVETSERNVVAPPGSSSSGPYYADVPADSLSIGDVVAFTGQIGLTGGFAGTISRSNQVTVQ